MLEYHQRELSERILEAATRFKSENRGRETAGGGLSLGEATEIALEKALRSLHQVSADLKEYRTLIENEIQRAREASLENDFDEQGLVSLALREYIQPSIEEYFDQEICEIEKNRDRRI